MISRRNFFRSLVIASAGIYLRIAPNLAKAAAQTGKTIAEEAGKLWVAHHREWINGRLVYSADSRWTLFE